MLERTLKSSTNNIGVFTPFVIPLFCICALLSEGANTKTFDNVGLQMASGLKATIGLSSWLFYWRKMAGFITKMQSKCHEYA
jgi:hypothetical protein